MEAIFSFEKSVEFQGKHYTVASYCKIMFSRHNPGINTPRVCTYYMIWPVVDIIRYIELLQSPFRLLCLPTLAVFTHWERVLHILYGGIPKSCNSGLNSEESFPGQRKEKLTSIARKRLCEPLSATVIPVCRGIAGVSDTRQM
jgi:hypothetical protein